MSKTWMMNLVCPTQDRPSLKCNLETLSDKNLIRLKIKKHICEYADFCEIR
jgi:hypothetical protein